jgi:hypothetical protein
MSSPATRPRDIPVPAHFLRLRLAAGATLALFAASACSSLELATVQADPREPVVAARDRGEAGAEADGTRGPDEPSPEPSGRARRRASRTPEATRNAEATVAPASTAARVAPVEPVAKAARKVKVLRLRPRPRRGPFEMNLYRPGDFVHQQTKDWCVAGSAQTMLNIIRSGRPNRSASYQRQLYVRGRRLSPKGKLGPIGVDLLGWARLLESAGHGPYVVDGAGSRYAAVKKAAKALRMTGRPVGFAVWRGAHSWVMSGFKATADPAQTRDFEVTAVYIQDVWYPYVSTIWGASRKPNSLVPVSRLREDFLPYQRPLFRHPDRDGRFMLVMPELPKGTVAR